MSIIYNEQTKRFVIETKSTTYAMQVELDRYLIHLYYGKRTDDIPGITFLPDRGFSAYPSDVCLTQEFGKRFSLNLRMLEFSGFDSGDYRSDAVRVKNADGNSVTSFTYVSYEIIEGRETIKGLPYASADKNTETLKITLRDDVSACEADLYYTVFPEEDVITRYFTLRNTGDSSVVLENAASVCLDLPHGDYDVVSFYGSHAHERTMQRNSLFHGQLVMASRRGATGAQMNNSFAVVSKGANETEGDAYGFEFVYSGSFKNVVEIEQSANARVLMGLHPEFFSWTVDAGESFTTPEAVMTYSAEGMGQMSRNLHKFIRRHIVRPCNTERRPVVLNTWEGNYFNIDEDRMVEFAKHAVACGIDMLVMDDGWFGKRINDRAGLGDWWANPDRFKNGLVPFVRRIKEQGIRFGIWIEPEMVNPDSDLYRAHPDWALCAEGRDHQRSRMQLVLDMTNPDVLAYLKKSFKETFEGVELDYIKWDFNRHLCQIASNCVPADRQGEVAHRFMLGAYELYQWFCDEYPDVMIENCSGGGGRYDLGMMKYSSQIWASDNTVPADRIFIQYGSTMMYPACVLSAHVANHEGDIEDDRLIDFAWKVAMQGVLGYEFDITTLSEKTLATIKRQISDYRRYEHIIENGELYRLMSPYDDKKSAFYYMTEEKDEILVFFYQIKGEQPREYRLKIDVPDGTKWRATLNRDAIYNSFDLNTGLVVRSSAEDSYAEMFHFVLDGKDKASETCEAECKCKCECESLTEYEKAELSKVAEGNERYEKLINSGKLRRITLDGENASAFCFEREDKEEYLICFCQKDGETPCEYRLALDVPSDSEWCATTNRDSTYYGRDIRLGLISRSKAEGGFFEVHHLYKRK